MTLAPMLAKAVPTIPEPDSVPGGLVYEPKWDGFRAILDWDGTHLEIGSRGSKPLTRYFPEVAAALAAQSLPPCVLDGELVVRTGPAGSERLDWEALSARIHPAESRVRRLAAETPASFVAFDLLALRGRDLTGAPFRERRRELEDLPLAAPLHRSQVTDDPATARAWFTDFEGAGLDGVVAKPLAAAYAPGKRVMLKVKHHRTADVVVVGYRVHTSGVGVGSLLLGLYDGEGTLRTVGGASAFSTARRRELEAELAPLVDGTGESEPSRFRAGKDTRYVRLRPERVVEVRYDQMEGDRFRHTVQVERWRDDREPRSCTFDQLELPVAYDLDRVLG